MSSPKPDLPESTYYWSPFPALVKWAGFGFYAPKALKGFGKFGILTLGERTIRNDER